MPPNEKLSDYEEALIVAYRGLGYPKVQIAELLDVSDSTIRKRLEHVNQRAESADHPLDVFEDVVEDLVDVVVLVSPPPEELVDG